MIGEEYTYREVRKHFIEQINDGVKVYKDTNGYLKVEKYNDLTLDAMQKAVGGNIEILYSPCKKYAIICNEEAKLNDHYNNVFGSYVFGDQLEYIAGDIIVMPTKLLK